MRSMTFMAVIFVGFASTASAATVRTFEATFGNIINSNGAYELLRLNPNDAANRRMTFKWTVEKTPVFGSSLAHIDSPTWIYDRAYWRYTDFSVTIGNLTFNGLASTNTSSSVQVQDGVSNGTNAINDFFRVGSFGRRGAPVANVAVNYTFVQAYDADNTTFGRSTDETPLSGLWFLSASEMNALSFKQGRIGIEGYGRRADLIAQNGVFRETTPLSAVPIPASLPLLFAGLGVLTLMRRKPVR